MIAIGTHLVGLGLAAALGAGATTAAPPGQFSPSLRCDGRLAIASMRDGARMR